MRPVWCAGCVWRGGRRTCLPTLCRQQWGQRSEGERAGSRSALPMESRLGLSDGDVCVCDRGASGSRRARARDGRRKKESGDSSKGVANDAFDRCGAGPRGLVSSGGRCRGCGLVVVLCRGFVSFGRLRPSLGRRMRTDVRLESPLSRRLLFLGCFLRLLGQVVPCWPDQIENSLASKN